MGRLSAANPLEWRYLSDLRRPRGCGHTGAMAYARKMGPHAAEAGTASSRIVYRGDGDVPAQRHPSGLTSESHIHRRPLVADGGSGCHLRFVGYLEGLLCHCYYPFDVEILSEEGPVAAFRVAMASDYEGWHHFYDVSCDYVVFEDLPEVVLIKVAPRLRKGGPALEPPRVRLNHVGNTLRDGGLSVFSYDPDGPAHRDHTTGEDSTAYNLRSLMRGDAEQGLAFPGSLHPRGSDFIPTLTRGIIKYYGAEGATAGDAPASGWLFRIRDFAGTYLTPGWYCCLDLDGGRALTGEESLFALWFQAAGQLENPEALLGLERAMNAPLPVSAELHVDDLPAAVTVTNQWHRGRRLAPLVLPPTLVPLNAARGIAASGGTGAILLRDLAPYERRAVGSIDVRSRYVSDREIELENRTPGEVPLILVLRDKFAYDAKSFDPDQFLELYAGGTGPIPYRVHQHRVRLAVPPGRSTLRHRTASFAPYRGP